MSKVLQNGPREHSTIFSTYIKLPLVFRFNCSIITWAPIFNFSAIQVLENEGQIFVTLCKGQGGTPADRPMRAWHDSWQVVSMAANAGLILVAADLFQVEDFEAYTSTGFR